MRRFSFMHTKDNITKPISFMREQISCVTPANTSDQKCIIELNNGHMFLIEDSYENVVKTLFDEW